MNRKTLLSLLAGSCFLAAANATIFPIDFETESGYESGNLAGQPSSGTVWARTNGSDDSMIEVAQSVGFAGSMGLRNIQGGNSDFTYYRITPTNDNLGVTFNAASSVLDYSFQWRLDSVDFGGNNGAPVFQFAMGGTEPAAQDAIFQFDIRNGGRFFVANGGSNLVIDGRFTPGTWHTISGTVDFSNDTFTVAIDGTQLFTTTNFGNIPFRADSAQNANIYLANRNASTGNANYLAWNADNISIIPEPRVYAAIFGLLAIGFVLVSRRRRA